MKRGSEDFSPVSEWLRNEQPPFTEEDYAAMRRGAWRRIEEEQGTRAASRPRRLILAGVFCAAAAVALLWLRPPSEGPVVAAAASGRARETFLEGVPPISSGGHLAGRGDVDDSRSPASAASHSSSAPRPRPRAGARSGALPGGDAVVKIEFQTANPDVRIIWLVQKGEAAPRLNPASLTEEAS